MNWLATTIDIYHFLIPVIVMSLTEVAKLFIEKLRTGLWSRKLFQHGGMPSSHSAFVTSLLLLIARESGIRSSEFSIAFVIACLVWYEAIAARGTVGEQARVLNLMQELEELTETVGHSFFEVVIGVLFGAGLTLGIFWLLP